MLYINFSHLLQFPSYTSIYDANAASFVAWQNNCAPENWIKDIEIKYPVYKIALKNIFHYVTKTLPDIQCKYMQIPTVFKSFHLNTRHYFLVNIMQPIWQNQKSERKQNPTFKLNMCKKKKKKKKCIKLQLIQSLFSLLNDSNNFQT